MVRQLTAETKPEIVYPESDGQAMADNTRQFQWIVTIKENLEILFADNENVFVAGDLLWYPVEGDNKKRQAPDAMVIFGRPKGHRGSYQQWKEDNIAPQVVFEILSPGNYPLEMSKKLVFYQHYGVEEYYIYDPQRGELSGFLREGDRLEQIEEIDGWISPRLQIRFQLTADTLEIYRPDGRLFLTPVELDRRAEDALTELEEERKRYRDLIEKLREKGIDPDQL
jgi:Uma2 family endonuclease